MTPELPSDVADALGLLLGTGDATHQALRRQVPHLRISARCTCGCGTTYFGLDADAVPAAPSPAGTVVVAQAQLFDAEEDWIGEVLAFARNGYLTWLEICSITDSPLTLTDALRMLRPSGVSGTSGDHG
ncbi:hypothetical protein [Streptomyces sp. NPDC014746]|uniref:hypothetical protein n=1 Tax=Streptomyces sp. NPDC014746 TaxID=3364904 RepID=UPI0037000432